jgi:PIN domain nuclease of toxin-antitoxin system
MRLLLDTHAFVWWVGSSPRLPARIHATLSARSSDLHVSAATVWEMAIKAKKGKFPAATALLQRLDELLAHLEIRPVAVTHDHGRHAGALSNHHDDPFDRMLAAQAVLEGLALVSADRIFDRYGIERIW